MSLVYSSLVAHGEFGGQLTEWPPRSHPHRAEERNCVQPSLCAVECDKPLKIFLEHSVAGFSVSAKHCVEPGLCRGGSVPSIKQPDKRLGGRSDRCAYLSDFVAMEKHSADAAVDADLAHHLGVCEAEVFAILDGFVHECFDFAH